MQLQQLPFYYSLNAPGLVQANAAVGQPQNIMIPSANSSGGSATPGLPPLHYANIYAGKVKWNQIYLIYFFIF
jgi:hypothetical protein